MSSGLRSTDKKLDCVLTFPDHTTHQAQVHLIEVEYGHYLFWFGAAHFSELNVNLPIGVAGGRCDFPDGRGGGISYQDVRISEGGYFEAGFVGITALR
jgi:hypothetical protein